jgi:hypothetical protein
MAKQNKLYTLDNETLNYMETIPKSKRSQTVREAIILHKFRHRQEIKEEIKKIKVRIIG